MKTLYVTCGIFSHFRTPDWEILTISLVTLTLVIALVYFALRARKPHTCEYCNTNEAYQVDKSDKYICPICLPGAINKESHEKEYRQARLAGIVFISVFCLLFGYLCFSDGSLFFDNDDNKEKLTFYYNSYEENGQYDTDKSENVGKGIDLIIKKEPTAKIAFVSPIVKSETDKRVVGYIIGATKEETQGSKKKMQIIDICTGQPISLNLTKVK